MNLTYEEYLSLIPEDTKKIVKVILQYLYYFDFKKNSLKISGREVIKSPSLIGKTASVFLGACHDPEIKAKLQNKGFDADTVLHAKYNLEPLTTAQEKEIFEKNYNLFLNFRDESKYITQSVFDILRKSLSLGNSYEFTSNLTNLGVSETVIRYVKEVDNNLKKEARLELEEEIYKDIPVSVVLYLETASRIRELLMNEFSSRNLSENEYLKNDDSYIVPISLFLAILESDSKEKEDLIAYFSSKGITRENIKKLIRVPNTSEIKRYDSNPEAIKHLYKKYYEPSKDETSKKVSLTSVIKNVLDRSETRNLSIEKILEKLNVKLNDLSNLEAEVEAYAAIRQEREEVEYTKSFYTSLNVDTKEFINLATKIYQLLLIKMKDRKHNSDILSCEDDADTLALYIASTYFNTDLEKFYSGHGVTLEKVLKLLNISITREEVDKVKLNSKLTIDKFKKFVTGGVNQNRKPDTITVNDVTRNLCNRDFNKSMIMENIFEEIRRDINLPNDFTRMIDQYFADLEKKRVTELTKSFYLNKSNAHYVLLDNACKVYKTLQRQDTKQEHQDDELVPMSLLYSLLMLKLGDYEVYEYLGITKGFINKHYDFNIENYMRTDSDIDTVVNKISPYVEEKDGKLTVKIFDKQRKSLALSRFLAKRDLTYSSFDDMSKIRTLIEEQQEEEQQKKENEKLFNNLNQNSENIIKDAIKIFEKLKAEKTDAIKELSENEIVELAMFLGILKNYNNKDCISKYGITYALVLEILGYDDFELNDEYSFETLKKYFISYCKSKNNNRIDEQELCLRVLDSNSKIIRSIIESLNIDYEIFKTEFIYRKDYLETLSLEQRKEFLESSKTPELEVGNTTDIMLYGSDLGVHTKYINSEYPTLMSTGQKNSDTRSIQEIVSQVYTKKVSEPKKQSWFSRIFPEPEIVEEYEIDNYALDGLKRKISNQIIPLYDDIKMFEQLAEYMEVYRRKNLEYLDKVNRALEQFRERHKEIAENDIIERLKLDTYIKALEAKRESFVVTDQLIKNYIYSIYVLIQGDLITITGLEMSRDTLIPLIGAGKLIGTGVENQRDGINGTKFVMSLLGNVVSKNNEGMKQNLEQLKQLGVSDERLLQISTDVSNYMKQITSSKQLELPTLESLPLQLPDEDSNSGKKYFK